MLEKITRLKELENLALEGLRFDLRHGDYTTQGWGEKVERNELDAKKGVLFKDDNGYFKAKILLKYKDWNKVSYFFGRSWKTPIFQWKLTDQCRGLGSITIEFMPKFYYEEVDKYSTNAIFRGQNNIKGCFKKICSL